MSEPTLSSLVQAEQLEMCSSLSLLTTDRDQLAEQVAGAQVICPFWSQVVHPHDCLTTGLGQHQPQVMLPSSSAAPFLVTHTLHQPVHPSSPHLQASAAIKQQELEALQAKQAEHSSAVERRLAQAECRAAESQAACEESQAQLLEAREHQQELSRQVYMAEQAGQQLRAKVGGAQRWDGRSCKERGACCQSEC